MTSEITTEDRLRELIGAPLQRALDKDRSALSDVHRDWLAASPFCLVATSDAAGRCDVSPRGDPPGFALALDDRTIAMPERPGNRRTDSLLNILQNPHVGLLFMVPGRGDTLRVNGRARLLSDVPYADRMEVKGHRPTVVLEVAVEQVFFHCAKAFMRAALWDPQSWAPDALPSRARIAHAVERADEPLLQVEAHYGPSYSDGLYRT
jgi:PPOX class probable FMN-dependent enzyme